MLPIWYVAMYASQIVHTVYMSYQHFYKRVGPWGEFLSYLIKVTILNIRRLLRFRSFSVLYGLIVNDSLIVQCHLCVEPFWRVERCFQIVAGNLTRLFRNQWDSRFPNEIGSTSGKSGDSLQLSIISDNWLKNGKEKRC